MGCCLRLGHPDIRLLRDRFRCAHGARKRSRPLLLVYAVLLIIMLAAQGFALYFLYERFWGDIPEECVRKGLSFNTTGISLERPSDSFDSKKNNEMRKKMVRFNLE